MTAGRRPALATWLVVAMVMVMVSCASIDPLNSCPGARAVVIDDFSAPSIDAGKWKIDDPSGSLSRRDGSLVYNGTAASVTKLSARELPGPGFFILKFHDFHSSNRSPGGQYVGSYVALGLGSEDNFVRVMRGAVGSGGYFEANHFVDRRFNVWYVAATASEGMLGLLYDGATVTFFYNTGADASQGWTRVGPAVTPAWNDRPRLFISANPGGTGTTRIALDSVARINCPGSSFSKHSP